jgi:hypothetical protein
MQPTAKLTTTVMAGLLLSGAGALAQPAPPPEMGGPVVPGPTAAPAPPVSPVAPSQRPEAFGYYLERGQSVTDRRRPELDPLGVNLGGFFLYPRIELDETFNDNIFATKNGKQSDFITVISPTAELKSNWNNHALNATAGANIGRYIDNDDEDYEDAFAGVDGRLDITRNLAAFGALRYERLHEERDSPDNPGPLVAAEPVTFNAYTARAGVVSRGLRIGYQADFGFRREQYDNVDTFLGGSLDLGARDVNVYQGNLRVSYEFAPRYEAFIRGGVNHRSYDIRDPAGFKRDSTGFRTDVGATIDLTGVTFAEVYVGYVRQEYEAGVLGEIDGIDFGSRVVWNPTQLTSVTFNLDRRVQDTNTFAQGLVSPGYLRTNVGLVVDHELLRNVLISGRVGYQNDDYERIDRDDNRFDVGVGARYSLNRNFYFGGSYTFSTRNSSGSGSGTDFTRNLVLLRLGAQL